MTQANEQRSSSHQKRDRAGLLGKVDKDQITPRNVGAEIEEREQVEAQKRAARKQFLG
jgi:hypothetical protein